MGAYTAVVVGTGGISDAWIPHLLQEKVKIVGLVDIRSEHAVMRAKKHGLDAEVGTDLKGMLKKKAPDFVVDLTIPDAHAEVTCTALSHGCHVIGEKPMAHSMEAARKMVRASEKSGKLYMVSQSRRYQSVHAQLGKMLCEKKCLGELTTVNVDFYIGAHFGGFRDEMPSPLILDMSIHHFDLMRMMSGCDPVSVYAYEFNPKGSWYRGDVSATCVFEMSDGVVFTYRGSWCAEGCHTSWHGDWRFIGTQGTLCYEGERVRAESVSKTGTFFSTMKPIPFSPKIPRFSGQHGAIRELLVYLKKGSMPQGECHDNIKSLAMVFAAMKSARTGRREKISLG